MAVITLIAIAVGVILLYHFVFYPICFGPVAGIPAIHPLARFSSLYMLWVRFWDYENAAVSTAHQKHGEVVRLGPRELSVNCVDDGIKTIYGKNFDRHDFYRVYEDCGRHNLSSSLDASSHAVRKKRVTHTYSKSYIHSSQAVAGIVDQLIRRRVLSIVGTYAKDEQPFDTMKLLSALALDIVTGYTFGMKNGTNFLQDTKGHARCISRIHKGRPYPMMFWLHEFPGTIAWLENIGILSKDRYKSLEDLHCFCLDMCDRAEAALASPSVFDTVPEDFPTVYQQFRRALDKEGLSTAPSVNAHSPNGSATFSAQQLEIAAEVGDQVHASDETLSVTLTYAIWELSRDSKMQQRLRQEAQALGSNVSASSTAALPASRDVDALPLLHAVVMETMRVHPIVAGGQARVTPHGKLSKLGAYENIPGGYRVQSYARFLHHNTTVFPDPLAWCPERWLEPIGEPNAPGQDQKMRWFWAFSSGARMCLGSHLALLVMKNFLLLLYANFETYIVDDKGIEHMEGYVGGPKSGELLIRTKAVDYNEG